jgi:hypothetical protein
MIAPNGLAILYGFARGTVTHMTGCSRFGKIVLPSVNFIELIRRKGQEEFPIRLVGPKDAGSLEDEAEKADPVVFGDPTLVFVDRELEFARQIVVRRTRAGPDQANPLKYHN